LQLATAPPADVLEDWIEERYRLVALKRQSDARRPEATGRDARRPGLTSRRRGVWQSGTVRF
jgi:hypothetical protein